MIRRTLTTLLVIAGVLVLAAPASAHRFPANCNSNSFDLNIASLYQGPSTLYVSRVDAGAFFDWAVQAGGDNSGMGLTPRVALSPWDIVLTGHASHSVTVAGMFHTKAYFGDQVPEALDAVEGTGNPFVLHLNSQAEYDYCP